MQVVLQAGETLSVSFWSKCDPEVRYIRLSLIVLVPERYALLLFDPQASIL